MNHLEQKIIDAVRNVPDFPKKGINFKDITTLMMNPELSNEIVEELAKHYQEQEIDKIAGIESRGFLIGYALALKLNKPFILIRKKGKLPFDKIEESYDLEYGTATIEMHADAVENGEKILIHDDLLATGGSAEAASKLIQKCGGNVVGFNFIIALSFLKGQTKLNDITENIIILANC